MMTNALPQIALTAVSDWQQAQILMVNMYQRLYPNSKTTIPFKGVVYPADLVIKTSQLEKEVALQKQVLAESARQIQELLEEKARTAALATQQSLDAATLQKAGIPIALQSGYESYVPKTRVVLFEAGLAAAHGLSFSQALAAITIDAAKIIGVADRVGSLEVGKDADIAIFDGDPFEYTTHCTGVVIDGQVMSTEPR
jgi:imidazolonepropionase-like amidohydrolase